MNRKKEKSSDVAKAASSPLKKRNRSVRLPLVIKTFCQEEKSPTVDLITKRFIEPLNDATRRLFRPILYAKTDRMHISLDDSGKHFVLKCYALAKRWNSNEMYEVGPSWSVRRFLERIPERKIISYSPQIWKVAGTDFSAILINALWERERLEFDDDAKILFDFLLMRFLKQTQNSRIKAAYKLQGEIPTLPDDFIDHPKKPLMSFQRVALATQINEDGANLWMEQGTGKTPIIIARINLEARRICKKENRMYRSLVVAPKNMRLNWRNKLIEFAVNPGKITVMRGGKLDRMKLFVEAFKPDNNCEYIVVICSYETVLRDWETFRMIEWDLCTLDESHMIKGHYTKRWKALQKLRELCNSRTGLTGTPIANNLFDTWTQLEWLGEGLSGFTSYKAFKKYYGTFVRSGDGQRDILTGYAHLPLLQERFSRLCFMITRDEAMPELPKKTYDIEEFEMTSFQREAYIKLQKQLAFEIAQDKQNTSKRITADHILTKLLRLSQITAGYIKWDAEYDDDGLLIGGGNVQFIEPNPKVDALVEHLKNKKPTEKTIIWTNWVPVIKMLHARFDKEGIKHVLYYGGTSDKDREEAERSYNQDPEVRVFIGNPAAGGTGLDLWGYWPDWAGTDRDRGTNTTQEIYYSQNWSMIHRSQSEDRPVRKFTRVSVQITDWIFPNTIDEEIAIRVLDKAVSAAQLQDVSVIMRRILDTIPMAGESNGQQEQ